MGRSSGSRSSSSRSSRSSRSNGSKSDNNGLSTKNSHTHKNKNENNNKEISKKSYFPWIAGVTGLLMYDYNKCRNNREELEKCLKTNSDKNVCKKYEDILKQCMSKYG